MIKTILGYSLFAALIVGAFLTSESMPLLNGLFWGTIWSLIGIIILALVVLARTLSVKYYSSLPQDKQKEIFIKFPELLTAVREKTTTKKIVSDVLAGSLILLCFALGNVVTGFSFAVIKILGEVVEYHVNQFFELVFAPTIKNSLSSKDKNVREFFQLMNERYLKKED